MFVSTFQYLKSQVDEIYNRCYREKIYNTIKEKEHVDDISIPIFRDIGKAKSIEPKVNRGIKTDMFKQEDKRHCQQGKIRARRK